MITSETITARFAADRHATIAWKKQLSADLDAIVTAYGAADKPADTIATVAAEIGIDRVRAIIATLTVYRVAMHDRRIGDDTAAWAQTIADALDADAAERVGLITDAIHPAHLDQLARAAAEYVAPETTETTETAPAAEPETETETAPAAETETVTETAEAETAETETAPAAETTEAGRGAEQTGRTERTAAIPDAVRREIIAGYYRPKQRVTARCIREAERAGAPTVCVGYCGAQWLLSYLTPAYYTAGTYGWNCDVYIIAGLTICTGYRGMVGEPAVLTADYERRARAAADEDERSAILAEWIAANLDAIQTAREGVRA